MKWDNDDTSLTKTFKGATMGLAAGTIWGTVIATWYNVPRVERSVALPGLIRTLKMMGNYGARFAVIGGVYIGVEQLLEHYRTKKDLINGAVGGFVAGAAVHGYTVIGGVYIGVEQLLEHYRTKKDLINGAVGGFVAGAAVHGYTARSIPTALYTGASLHCFQLC